MHEVEFKSICFVKNNYHETYTNHLIFHKYENISKAKLCEKGFLFFSFTLFLRNLKILFL